ncbi:hypothetical protein CHUAL_006667 [Chamberlinius hualienensis]
MEVNTLKEELQKTMDETAGYISKRKQLIEEYLEEVKATKYKLCLCKTEDELYHRLEDQMDYKVHLIIRELNDGKRKWMSTEEQLNEINKQAQKTKKLEKLGGTLVITLVVPLIVLFIVKPYVALAGICALGMATLGITWREDESKVIRRRLTEEIELKKQEVKLSESTWETYKEEMVATIQAIRAFYRRPIDVDNG